MEISIIVPVYNEQENIRELFHRLTAVMSSLRKSYEIVFINDGSIDQSMQILRRIRKDDDHLKVISFRRNFGQTAALDAGFQYAKGSIIVTLDADLQNDPADIPRLLGKLDEGYDVISGWRWPRRDPWHKKIFSKMADQLRRLILNDKVHDSGCTLKAYRKETVKGMRLFGEMHRYIPAIVAADGFKVGEIKVQHHKRKHGKTKYGMGRLLRGFLDLFYLKFWKDFSTRPLHFFGSLGFGCIVLGAAIGIVNLMYHLYINHRVIVPVGPLQLLGAILVLLGIQFIVLGFLGEINIRTYYSKSKETNYKIREILE